MTMLKFADEVLLRAKVARSAVGGGIGTAEERPGESPTIRSYRSTMADPQPDPVAWRDATAKEMRGNVFASILPPGMTVWPKVDEDELLAKVQNELDAAMKAAMPAIDNQWNAAAAQRFESVLADQPEVRAKILADAATARNLHAVQQLNVSGNAATAPAPVKLSGDLTMSAAGISDSTVETPKSPPLLDTHEIDILRKLAKAPLPVSVKDLRGFVVKSNATTDKALKRLEGFKYVHRPHGPRKGLVITEAGKRALKVKEAELQAAKGGTQNRH
jgi:DNA-binding MarR family transcriptional regulator